MRSKTIRHNIEGRLLVVDDNEMNRDMLSRRLSRKGYTVDTANDGHEALAMVTNGTYELILLDIMMPGISGLEVLGQLRERYTLADLPVIMATAKDESADIVAALKLGANDYVTKPLDFPVVLARVGSQLALKQATEEIKRLASEVELRNAFIRKVFGRYLSDDIVDGLLETPEGLELGGATREITILMADIRGFSVLSAQLTPQQTVSLVNNFLSVMTEVIIELGGTIDEFIGDAILVLFGAPVARADHARAAVACAVRMQQAMAAVNEKNRADNLPEVECGIGINTGEVIVGNIGSSKRAKYGVVGANVNLAARIESYTVGGQVLIADATRVAAGEGLALGDPLEVRPKGSDETMTLHDVTGLDGEQVPQDEIELATLTTPLAAQYRVMSGKDAGGQPSSGTVRELGARHLLLTAADAPLKPLTNLKLELADAAGKSSGEMFAKVLQRGGDNGFLLRLTSIPSAARDFLTAL